MKTYRPKVHISVHLRNPDLDKYFESGGFLPIGNEEKFTEQGVSKN